MPGAYSQGPTSGGDTGDATLYLDDEEDRRGGVKRLRAVHGDDTERCLPNSSRSGEHRTSPSHHSPKETLPMRPASVRPVRGTHTPGSCRSAGAHPIRGHQSSRLAPPPPHPKVLPGALASGSHLQVGDQEQDAPHGKHGHGQEEQAQLCLQGSRQRRGDATWQLQTRSPALWAPLLPTSLRSGPRFLGSPSSTLQGSQGTVKAASRKPCKGTSPIKDDPWSTAGWMSRQRGRTRPAARLFTKSHATTLQGRGAWTSPHTQPLTHCTELDSLNLRLSHLI